jgi:hypothetical protein
MASVEAALPEVLKRFARASKYFAPEELLFFFEKGA